MQIILLKRSRKDYVLTYFHQKQTQKGTQWTFFVVLQLVLSPYPVVSGLIPNFALRCDSRDHMYVWGTQKWTRVSCIQCKYPPCYTFDPIPYKGKPSAEHRHDHGVEAEFLSLWMDHSGGLLRAEAGGRLWGGQGLSRKPMEIAEN